VPFTIFIYRVPTKVRKMIHGLLIPGNLTIMNGEEEFISGAGERGRRGEQWLTSA